jgi:hypothetical protein
MYQIPMTVDDIEKKKLPLKQSTVLGLLIILILGTASKLPRNSHARTCACDGWFKQSPLGEQTVGPIAHCGLSEYRRDIRVRICIA